MSGDVLAALARALRQARANPSGSEQRGARILFDVLSQDGVGGWSPPRHDRSRAADPARAAGPD